MNEDRGQSPLLSPDSVLHRAAERLAHQFAKRVPEVLYLCVQNSGRSQIAAALTRHLPPQPVASA